VKRKREWHGEAKKERQDVNLKKLQGQSVRENPNFFSLEGRGDERGVWGAGKREGSYETVKSVHRGPDRGKKEAKQILGEKIQGREKYLGGEF